MNNNNYVRRDAQSRVLIKKKKAREQRNRLIILQVIVFLLVAASVFSLVFIPGNATLIDMDTVHPASISRDSEMSSANGIDYSFLIKPIADEISSSNAILIDLASGEIMAEKLPDEKVYPASITKIMTAIVVLEYFSDTEVALEVPSHIFPYLTAQNSSVAGFYAGEKVKVIDLLYGLLLPSGGDAALTLANAVAGNEQAFAKMMTEKAQEIGANNTNFKNSTGLHSEDHYSTVRDLSKILTYALKNETFRTIFTAEKYVTSPTNKRSKGITFTSTTFAAFKRGGITNDYVIGGKTGYTGDARLCLATLAQKNGREYILVTVGAGTPTSSRGTQHAADAAYIYENFA